MKKSQKKKTGQTLAERADRHVLYEKSVQDTAEEYEFVSGTFEKLRGRKATRLREDFCGTAAMCCEWVRQGKDHTAVGIDIDSSVLAWGREHNLSKLDDDQHLRVKLLQDDVCTADTPAAVDVLLAMNFSYQVFKSRDQLRDYFRHAREALVDDGIMFIDAFGGYEVYEETREKRKFKGFKYVWDHAKFNPITNELLCHIHFTFADGSKMEKAFTYDWRLWSLPELTEIFLEAGFSQADVYWEELDETGEEGTGVYSPATVGDSDPGWVCFVVAQK